MDAIQRSLAKMIAGLEEDLEIVTNQINSTVDDVQKNKLNRKRESIVEELKKLREEAAPSHPPIPQEENVKGEPLPPNIKEPFKPGGKYAFLAGVNEYEDARTYGRLDFCSRDAAGIRSLLASAGYDERNIELIGDDTEIKPTHGNIMHRFNLLAQRTTRDDTLLFYYSGHGEADKKETYLVSRDGFANSLEYTAVKLSEILKIMRQCPAAKCIVILDACFSGADIPRKSATKMSKQFINNVFQQSEGLLILSSCTKGESSFLWKEKKCSVFTYYLLKALKSHPELNEGLFVTVQDVNRIVKDGVDRWVRKNGEVQTPTIWGAMAGDMIIADYRGEQGRK